VVDKPAGMTSHDVVGLLRRRLGERRIGHSGTLDPDATGVLLCGVGNLTRFLRYLTDLPKTYTAEVIFGSTTSSLDDSGEVTGTFDMGALTRLAAWWRSI
jgi:tRNA pseudouridine55 synthase